MTKPFLLALRPSAKWRVVILWLLLFSSSLAAADVHAAPSAQGPENLYLPLVSNNNCSAQKGLSRFGVQLYGGSEYSSSYFPFLMESGATWFRNELAWGLVEPANVDPPQFNWGIADRIVAGAQCFNIILTHYLNPSWAATRPQGPIDKVGLDEFAEYIGALVERYDGDGNADAPGSPVVNYYEFFNEPDARPTPNGGRWGNNGADYAEMLETVYPVVKAANPNAQVLLGGVAHDLFVEDGGIFVRSFIDDVLKAGGGNFFDIMNFHQYSAFANNWTTGKGPGLIEKTAAIRQILAANGVNKPFFITEAGWHNNGNTTPASSDEEQMRHVVALYVQSMAANVDVLIWWPFVDIGPTYQFDMGLVTFPAPRQRKPAFFVYKILIEEMRTAQFVRTLPASETGNADLEVHHFVDTKNGQILLVAWLDPLKTTASAPLQLATERVSVRSMEGVVTIVADEDDGRNDGKVSLTISRPVYIRFL